MPKILNRNLLLLRPRRLTTLTIPTASLQKASSLKASRLPYSLQIKRFECRPHDYPDRLQSQSLQTITQQLRLAVEDSLVALKRR